MPASHNFSANQLRERIIAVLNVATLEVMVQTQTELQLMVSQPGKGRLYAKTAQGQRNLARFLDERAGLSRKNLQRSGAVAVSDRGGQCTDGLAEAVWGDKANYRGVVDGGESLDKVGQHGAGFH